MSLLVKEVLVEASIFNQMKLDTVPEILSDIANKYMYLDTSSRIFAKKVRDNYPVVGKLGVSILDHIVSWKQDDYNCIYISTDEKIPVKVRARRRPYGWHVTQESFFHQSHESWKVVDQKAWFDTNDARVTSTKDEIQQYEEIILTELSLERIKVMKHGQECRYYLKCNWKNVLRKNQIIERCIPTCLLRIILKQTMIMLQTFIWVR